MASKTATCSSGASAQSACASETPRCPRSTRRCSGGQSRSANNKRPPTQRGLLPSNAATTFVPAPFVFRSAATIRASSMALSVRGGALAASTLDSVTAGELRSSMTTGTVCTPLARACCRRLKPSTTSKKPSPVGVTRSGISASPEDAPRHTLPSRRTAKLVCNRCSGSICTRPKSPIMAVRRERARQQEARAPDGSRPPRRRGTAGRRRARSIATARAPRRPCRRRGRVRSRRGRDGSS